MNYKWTIKTIPKTNKIYNLLLLYDYFREIPLLNKIFKKKVSKLLHKNHPIQFTPGFSTKFNNIIGTKIDLSNCKILDFAPVEFGENTVVGPDCKIITSWHLFENFNQVRAKEIKIGKNCWITMNCIILSGVEIGDNCVIGAGSVVTSNIPSDSFAAGNPAKIIRKIERTYEWWDDQEYLLGGNS